MHASFGTPGQSSSTLCRIPTARRQAALVPSNATIGSLTIRDSPLTTRGDLGNYKRICELAGKNLELRTFRLGSGTVLAGSVGAFGRRWEPGVESVKPVPTRHLDDDPLLSSTLKPIWIMICPDSDFGLMSHDFTIVLRDLAGSLLQTRIKRLPTSTVIPADKQTMPVQGIIEGWTWNSLGECMFGDPGGISAKMILTIGFATLIK